MKKTISITIAVILCSVCFLTYKFYDVTNVEDTSTNKIKQNNNMLSMMLETEAGSGKYEMTTSSSWPTDGYVFNSELSKCENGGKLSWDDTNKKVMFEGNNVDKCYVYFDVSVPPTVVSEVCSGGETLSSCIIKLSKKSTSTYTNIYHHDGTLENGINDGSYRYAGASEIVNNFVCFGSNAEVCPTDNLYRIIGAFDNQVKLIKYDYATNNLLGTNGDYYRQYIMGSSNYKGNNYSNISSYCWNYKNDTSINDGAGSNEWSTSLLNTINLNINYLSNIGTLWANMIENTTWKVSGHTVYNNITASTMYTAEISKATKTYGTSKIGLMYVSDYGFAASPSAWTKSLGYNLGNGYNSVTSENWMYMGLYEVTISPYSDDIFNVFTLIDSGHMNPNHASNDFAVRPVFYLSSSVTYVSGDGTQNSPIRLS